MKTIKTLFIFVSVMLTSGVLLAQPQSPGEMDGDYMDWKGGEGGPAVCFADESGVDEQGPKQADITEYCLSIDSDESGGLYLLMAMDDTEPKDADVRIVIDIDGNQIPDYSVNNTLDSDNQNGLSTAGVTVNECENGECSLNDLVALCGDGGEVACTGSTEGFNNNWPSQFTSSKCDGANCETLDGFVEVFVPWQWLGGSPPDSYLFGLYLSAHSGGTEDTSSEGTGQGVACNASGCYTSGPTAVTLHFFNAGLNEAVQIWPFILALLLSSIYLIGIRFRWS